MPAAARNASSWESEMHLVAPLYKHFVDFPASRKILQRRISLCSMQMTYISNSQEHNEIYIGDAFLWKTIFCIFIFHEAVLSLGSSNFTLVYLHFDNVFSLILVYC